MNRTKPYNISSSSPVHDTALNSSETRGSRKQMKYTQSKTKNTVTKHRMPSKSFAPSLRDEGNHHSEMGTSVVSVEEKPKLIKTVQQGKLSLSLLGVTHV